MEYRLVDGVELAEEAGCLLRAAWRPPCLHYTGDYLRWQCSFPGPWPAPAAAAFDGSRLAGFAGSTHRRMRIGGSTAEAVVVSFVAVHPEARNRGVAAGLYRTLLPALRERGAAVLTYAQADSAGQRAIERSYPAAGFALRAFGMYPVYGALTKEDASCGDWKQCPRGEEARAIRDAIQAQGDPCSSDPSIGQIEHALRDPRGRVLLIKEGTQAAAWVVRSEFASAGGVSKAVTVDCVWMPRNRAEGLVRLAAAALKWGAPGERAATISMPSLFGFDPPSLRRAGIRQIAPPFAGYAAGGVFASVNGSNLEVV